MKTTGWIFMLASLAIVWTTLIWSYYKLLTAKKEDD